MTTYEPPEFQFARSTANHPFTEKTRVRIYRFHDAVALGVENHEGESTTIYLSRVDAFNLANALGKYGGDIFLNSFQDSALPAKVIVGEEEE